MERLMDKLTQTQAADLPKYVPNSPTVRMVFEDLLDIKIDNWEEAVAKMIEATLDGDADSLFDLLELTYLNAHNEGLIEASADAGA